MNSKIVKEIRKFINEKYPGLKEKDPSAYKRLVNKIKAKYKNTPWNKKFKVVI